MTENAWDEIWNKPAFKFLSYSPDELVKVPGTVAVDTDWLKMVKAEGDRLQREGLEHHAIAVEYYEKLEAIKTHIHSKSLSTYGLNLRVGTRANINSKDLHAFLGDLTKILEAEGDG